MPAKSHIKKLEDKLKLYKSIEKTNTKFNSMPKAKKRIAIAEDILISLKIKKYSATSGNYLSLYTDVQDENPQTLLQHKDTRCNVCAIGALFVSKVKMGNKFDQNLNEDDDVDDDEMIENLKGIFNKKELRLIECAFEGDTHGGGGLLITDKEKDSAIDFHHKYDNSHKRLTAIMKNIVKNKGNFVLNPLVGSCENASF